MRVRISMLLGSLAVATAAGVIPLSGVAGAQGGQCAQPGYPPAQRGLTVAPGTLPTGGDGTLEGCADPNSSVGFTLFADGKDLGSTTANAAGFFSFRFRVPCGAEQGRNTIVAKGSGVVDGSVNLNVSGVNTAVCGQSAAVGNIGGAGRQSTVARRAASGGGGALPRTGSASTAPLTAAGIGLVLIGSAAVVVTRRRRSEAASATH